MKKLFKKVNIVIKSTQFDRTFGEHSNRLTTVLLILTLLISYVLQCIAYSVANLFVKKLIWMFSFKNQIVSNNSALLIIFNLVLCDFL